MSSILAFVLSFFGTAPSLKIESIESKNQHGGAVYNKIRLVSNSDRDIWLMRQSHDGPHLADSKWDELEIIVDKTTRPYSVSYHQKREGKEVEYRASCYLCHSNGPRQIRPNFESKEASLSLKEKALLNLYNLRIKSYGPIKLKAEKFVGTVPLKYDEEHEEAEIPVQTCLRCHNNDFYFGRGKLKRQHAETISHLVETGQMPPWPYKLSNKEKFELQKFLAGF